MNPALTVFSAERHRLEWRVSGDGGGVAPASRPAGAASGQDGLRLGSSSWESPEVTSCRQWSVSTEPAGLESEVRTTFRYRAAKRIPMSTVLDSLTKAAIIRLASDFVDCELIFYGRMTKSETLHASGKVVTVLTGSLIHRAFIFR